MVSVVLPKTTALLINYDFADVNANRCVIAEITVLAIMVILVIPLLRNERVHVKVFLIKVGKFKVM